MALKKRRPGNALKAVKEMAKGVKSPAVADNPNRYKERTAPLPSDNNLVEASDTGGNDRRKAREFQTITLSGTKGQKYRVSVPTSYAKVVPKVWEWNNERYRVAELIAQGIPIKQIPDDPGVNIKSRMTIYGWLEHPEFKEHVDGLVLETGWANRRERISNLSRLNEVLFNKVVKELDGVQLTDKMAGALLSAIQAGAKLLAQEKGEFVEESKVTQETTHNGVIGTATVNVGDFLKEKSEDERKELEKEFDNIGDDIIRQLTGSREDN